ncbi:MAG: amidohydrolase family protein [Acidobacteria bacterium]|nr:amidohydrolase family protein [Acidobacteriota bacterium]
MISTAFKRAGTIIVTGLVLAIPRSVAGQEFDVLIRGGRILDGTGNPDFRADVAIRGDRIVAVGSLSGATARRVIDATGRFVVPGFIDLHSHADRELAGGELEPRKAHNLVAQGITTVVGGADGRNIRWPLSDEIADLRKLGIGVNFVPMVGHSTVRRRVMGGAERVATPAEVSKMIELAREGMKQGAWGLGAGPEYRPARFSETEEIIALARVVADYDGFYFSHQRTQSPLPQWQYPSMVDRMPTFGPQGTAETIRIGRETGIRVVGSHIKTKGTDTWGWSAADVIQVNRARAEGVQVYFDQYPYETFGGGSHTMILPWALAAPGTDYKGGRDDPKWSQDGVFDNFRENLRKNLSDPRFGPLLIKDHEYYIRKKGGADRIIIVSAPFDATLVGKSLQEVAATWKVTPVDALFKLALDHGTAANPHAVRFRSMGGHPFDVENYMRQDYTATSTDGTISMRTEPGQHPRSYGAFVRKLSHYARDKQTISLASGVRSNSGLPAQIVGLRDRGLLREGYYADVVVFDYDRLADRATVLQPDLYPEGIDVVLVNGQVVVDGGQRTGALAGRVLLKTSATSSSSASR